MNFKKKIIFNIIIGLTAYLILFALCAVAHEVHEVVPQKNKTIDLETQKTDLFKLKSDITPEIAPGEVGITEKLGQHIPLTTRFTDENDQELELNSFINQPTLILPVFFRCPQSCGILLASLSNAINDVAFKPGKEYKVLAVSFDDTETPLDAREAKKNYLGKLRLDFPQADWKFLTGDAANIKFMTQSLGFKYKKLDDGNFVHPNVLICVAGDGKIIRYLYGTYFLPFDLSMSIAEAAKGTPEISIKKLMSYCFAYDPVGKRYVFKTFRITGIAILSFLAVFLFFLLRKKKEAN
jgi:protein SCO1